jgi:hypothetical protein
VAIFPVFCFGLYDGIFISLEIQRDDLFIFQGYHLLIFLGGRCLLCPFTYIVGKIFPPVNLFAFSLQKEKARNSQKEMIRGASGLAW